MGTGSGGGKGGFDREGRVGGIRGAGSTGGGVRWRGRVVGWGGRVFVSVDDRSAEPESDEDIGLCR